MMLLNLTFEEERKQREIDKYNIVRERERTHHTVLWCNVYARRQHTCTPAYTILCVHTCSRCMDCTMYACADVHVECTPCAYVRVFVWSAHGAYIWSSTACVRQSATSTRRVSSYSVMRGFIVW